MAYGVIDRCTGGTATASNSHGAYPPANAFDNNNATFWFYAGAGQWIQYDFGAGVSWAIGKAVIRGYIDSADGVKIEDFVIQGSNNGTDWTLLYTGTQANNENDQSHEYINTTKYRYVRIDIDDDASGYYGTNPRSGVREISMYEYIPSTKGGIAIGSPMIF